MGVPLPQQREKKKRQPKKDKRKVGGNAFCTNFFTGTAWG
jgi:hypothetical protein